MILRVLICMASLVMSDSALRGAEAPAKPQLLTPKAGALAFVRAMEAGEMAGFRAVTVGADEDYKLFEPLVGMVGAAKQLEKAAREKFGKEGAAIVRFSPAQGLEVHVQESDVKVSGQTAVLHNKTDGDADPLTLRKSDEGWKVDLSAIKNRQSMSDSAAKMRRMRDALAQCADDIRAGKFSSVEPAERAVLKRLRDAAG